MSKFCLPALAETPKKGPPPGSYARITPQSAAKAAAKLGIPPGSKFYPILLSAAGGRPAALPKTPEAPEAVIAHVRAKLGKELPSKEKFALARPDIKSSLYSADGRAKARAGLEAMTASYLETNSTFRQIPDCKTSETRRMAIKSGEERVSSKKIIFDMLFLRDSYVPLDPEEVFGRKTVLKKLSSQNPSLAVSAAAAAMKVPCMPYRMRGTLDTIYFDRGENALRNYDKDPTGAGELMGQMRDILLKLGGIR